MTRWTEKQLAEFLGHRGRSDTSSPPFKLPNNPPGAFALGRLAAGEMNKTEAAYAQRLEELRLARQVLWWKFEPITLRLAADCRYTPDFAVLGSDCVLELHEVKGFWRDDARVKIKVAAATFPFKFRAVTKKGGAWETEEFP